MQDPHWTSFHNDCTQHATCQACKPKTLVLLIIVEASRTSGSYVLRRLLSHVLAIGKCWRFASPVFVASMSCVFEKVKRTPRKSLYSCSGCHAGEQNHLIIHNTSACQHSCNLYHTQESQNRQQIGNARDLGVIANFDRLIMRKYSLPAAPPSIHLCCAS